MNTKTYKHSLIATLSFLLIYSSSLFAAEKMPANCIDGGYIFNDNNAVFQPRAEEAEQHLFLLQNISSANILLTHTDKRFVVDLSWRALLEPNRWSTLAIDQNNFEVTCSLLNENQETAVPCEQVLGICQFAKTRFALSSLGTYWPSQNKNMKQAITDARKKGIKVLRK